MSTDYQNTILNAVGYCRLSKEDGDKESSSIINEKKIIEEYAHSHNYGITNYYVDDGVSGYTMDRPGFNQLLQDIEANLINTVIVKDLSRLGRHNAKVQLFLEDIINANKRVIAIGDNYDTTSEAAQDIVGIQTWVNEKYVRDVSKKVRKAIEAMQKEGTYISCVPYGYCKDPIKKTVYYVDETCAMYVKEIFDMYVNGMGVNKIAATLTERGVPTGSMVLKQRLERMGRVYHGKASSQWHPHTIYSILRNDFYIGTLTLGKTKRRTIKGEKAPQPIEKQYVFENAHTPIIDKATFKLVQEILHERSQTAYRGKRIQQRPNAFTGVVYCGDCGSRLTSSSNSKDTRYICQKYNINGKRACTSHRIRESELTDALITFLEYCRENLSEAIKDIDLISKKSLSARQDNTIDVLEKDIERVESEIKVLLEQKMRDIMKEPAMADIIDGMYSSMLKDKYIQLSTLKTQLEDKRNSVIKDKELMSDLNNAMQIFNEVIESKSITKKQVRLLVDKIIVYADGGLDIYLRGNIHALCTNYIQFKTSDQGAILKATIDYIESTPNHITISGGWEYARSKGHHIGFQRYQKIFNVLLEMNYVVPNPGYNKGLRLNKPIKELRDDYQNNIIVNPPVRVQYNNVTLEIIQNIAKWSRSILSHNKKFKITTKKN